MGYRRKDTVEAFHLTYDTIADRAQWPPWLLHLAQSGRIAAYPHTLGITMTEGTHWVQIGDYIVYRNVREPGPYGPTSHNCAVWEEDTFEAAFEPIEAEEATEQDTTRV